MTQREFYTNVISANINEEITNYATAAIEKLDKRNAARSSKPTKSQIANASLMSEISTFLEGKKNVLASEIAAHFNITTQKASGILTLMVKDNKTSVVEVKVPKQGKRKAYTLVAEVEETEE